MIFYSYVHFLTQEEPGLRKTDLLFNLTKVKLEGKKNKRKQMNRIQWKKGSMNSFIDFWIPKTSMAVEEQDGN